MATPAPLIPTVRDCELLLAEFNRADTNKDNSLNLAEFRKCLGIVGEDPLLTRLLFRAFDEDNDGFINAAEYTRGALVMDRGCAEDKAHFAWRMYDLNKDGFITKDDIRPAVFAMHRSLFAMNVMVGNPKECVDELFRTLDTAGTGQVSRSQFIAAVTKNPLLFSSAFPITHTTNPRTSTIVSRHRASFVIPQHQFRKNKRGNMFVQGTMRWLARSCGCGTKPKTLKDRLIASSVVTPLQRTPTLDDDISAPATDTNSSTNADITAYEYEDDDTDDESNARASSSTKNNKIAPPTRTQSTLTGAGSIRARNNNEGVGNSGARSSQTDDGTRPRFLQPTDADPAQLDLPLAVEVGDSPRDMARLPTNQQIIFTPSEICALLSTLTLDRRSTKRAGQLVRLGSNQWNVMLTLMAGIRMGIDVVASPTNSISATLTPASFNEVLQHFVPDPSGKSDSMVMMSEYGPQVFRSLRARYGISDSNFLSAMDISHVLSSLLVGNIRSFTSGRSEGKSVAQFFFTYNNDFIIKTIEDKELMLLLRILRSYYIHMISFPSTLITRIFGCYELTLANGTQIPFVVMSNILNVNMKCISRYDLKGSYINRLETKQSLLKDSNWTTPVYLPYDVREALIIQLQQDTRFFLQHNIMDYSMLLGVYSAPSSADELDTSLQPRISIFEKDHGGVLGVSSDGTALPKSEQQVLVFGLIDVLTDYDFRRKSERFAKLCTFKDGKGISVAPPQLYASRFVDAMQSRIFAPTTPPPTRKFT